MSILNFVEKMAAEHLPKSLVRSLQNLKQQLPLKLQQSPPTVQTYINDGVTRSFVGVHNFYSVLQAERVTDATVELTFHAPDGGVALVHRRPLAHFGAESVDVGELFAKEGVSSPLGVVTTQITPVHARDKGYRELGQ